MRSTLFRVAVALLFAAAAPVSAETLGTDAAMIAGPVGGTCSNGTCQVRLTPVQLLQHASALVQERRFDEARPLVDALAMSPAVAMEAHFLSGYIAVETGNLPQAIAQFRTALVEHPEQTRIRLELARAMMLHGDVGAADYHFRLAQQDRTLTPQVQATIRAARGILRDRRPWHFSTDFGLAPDSNINNGSSAQSVDVVLGNQILPLALDAQARARSGTGQTGSVSAGYRFTLGERAGLLIDGDASGVNYKGKANDDYTVQLAAGPELRTSDTVSLSAQGVALQRWYGGKRAATQFGARFAVQKTLDGGQRLGLTLDARHTASGFASDYSGWTLSAYATYERVIARSLIATGSVFVRADRLNTAAYSSREVGVSLGLGGELPHGINAGITANLSRAAYDAPLALLSPQPRCDWRYGVRAYAGLRALRVLGFSPSASYSYTRNDSSLGLYKSSRSRFAFSLARYF